jgi:muramoyltetrapeptide carboxypeptidase
MLKGTEFMPSLKNAILFLEDNHPISAALLDRYICSLMLQEEFQYVRGVVLGRFQISSKITKDQLKKIITSKKELQKIPVISEADFGHTLPLFTFPIGGEAKLESGYAGIKLILTKR